jgi:glycosyltransferase involved in cell wall biosynthesis
LILRNARVVLGTGPLAIDALTALGARAETCHNFPYWIREDRFRLRSKSDANAQLYTRPIQLASLGRIDFDQKGQLISLQALSEVHAKGVEFAWHVAGTGSDMLLLQERVERLGLTAQVRFLGWLDQDAIVSLLEGVDILLHPAPNIEPYGVAILEAMAAGAVVVTTPLAGAAADRILDGVNGVLVLPGDATALANRIRHLAVERASLLDMGLTAQATAREWPISRAPRMLKDFTREIGRFSSR